jgi:hypothetical protein
MPSRLSRFQGPQRDPSKISGRMGGPDWRRHGETHSVQPLISRFRVCTCSGCRLEDWFCLGRAQGNRRSRAASDRDVTKSLSETHPQAVRRSLPAGFEVRPGCWESWTRDRRCFWNRTGFRVILHAPDRSQGKPECRRPKPTGKHAKSYRVIRAGTFSFSFRLIGKEP